MENQPKTLKITHEQPEKFEILIIFTEFTMVENRKNVRKG